MKRNLVIASLAVAGLAVPATAMASSPSTHPMIPLVKKSSDVSRHDSSRDRFAADRHSKDPSSKDAKSRDANSRDRSVSFDAKQKADGSSHDRTPSKDLHSDR